MLLLGEKLDLHLDKQFPEVMVFDLNVSELWNLFEEGEPRLLLLLLPLVWVDRIKIYYGFNLSA